MSNEVPNPIQNIEAPMEKAKNIVVTKKIIRNLSFQMKLTKFVTSFLIFMIKVYL